MDKLISLFGLLAFVGIAILFSNNRRRISWRLVIWGLGLQVLFAVFILPDSFLNLWLRDAFSLTQAPGAWLFGKINDTIVTLLNFTRAGVAFLATSFSLNRVDPGLHNFIFDVLPTILFFSGLMSILYHLGVIQVVVRYIARAMARTMGTSGSESLSASANIFVGQTEAPLVIKPYVATMTRSELLAIMVGGMATVSGGVMAAYVAFLSDYFPDIAGHLMAASIMSAPAALVISKILIPETEPAETAGQVKLEVPRTTSNVIEAAANGAADGLRLAANVAAMLLVFIAIIALMDAVLVYIGNLFSYDGLTFARLTGWLFSPLAFLMGVPFDDVMKAATILGQKTIINEFVAFKSLADTLSDPANQMSPRAVMLVTYALCGFSNFSSIAIQIGGIGSIAPGRRKDLARLGLHALLGGTLACLMTASLAGVISSGSTGTLNTAGAVTGQAADQKIADSFDTLRLKLSGRETLAIRTAHWKSVKDRPVLWQGRFYRQSDEGLLFYYGVKDLDDVGGHEENSFLLYRPGEDEDRRFLVWRFSDNKKEAVRLTAAELKPGDNFRQIAGRLSGYQVNQQVLFAVDLDKQLFNRLTTGDKHD